MYPMHRRISSPLVRTSRPHTLAVLLVRPEQARQNLHGGRLAGSVWSDEAEDLASADGEGERVEGGERAVSLGEGPWSRSWGDLRAGQVGQWDEDAIQDGLAAVPRQLRREEGAWEGR